MPESRPENGSTAPQMTYSHGELTFHPDTIEIQSLSVPIGLLKSEIRVNRCLPSGAASGPGYSVFERRRAARRIEDLQRNQLVD